MGVRALHPWPCLPVRVHLARRPTLIA